MTAIFVWIIALASILLMLVRPWRISEAVWVSAGALLLVLLRLLPFQRALLAIRMGLDVYLFLTGTMLVAELARHSGVFDWVAGIAVEQARGSSLRLFLLIYFVGIVVTSLLSNDATAVVLTPAVLAAVRRAEVNPLPHLLACALIANAASFILPVSNPANLVVYGTHLPALFDWVHTFWLPSVLSVVSTLLCLAWVSRHSLRSRIPNHRTRPAMTAEAQLALAGLLAGAAILLTASARGLVLGVPACVAAAFALLLVSLQNWRSLVPVVKGVSWSVLPLVAGLFIIVEALSGAGLLDAARFGFVHLASSWLGKVGLGLLVALLSNVMNNLPVGLAGRAALQHSGGYTTISPAVLLGVDLGPNLSVTGSLATILWLIALRRDNVEISAWQFFKAGMIIMPVSLVFAILGCPH